MQIHHMICILTVAFCCSQVIDFVFSPSVKLIHPASLDYLTKYNIKSADYVTDGILNMNFSIGLSAFRLGSFVSCVILYVQIHYGVLYVIA